VDIFAIFYKGSNSS